MVTLLQLLRSGLHPPKLPFRFPLPPEDDGEPPTSSTETYDPRWTPHHVLQFDTLVSVVTDSFIYSVSNRLEALGKADPVVPTEITQGIDAGFRWFGRRLDSTNKEEVRVSLLSLLQPLVALVSFIDGTLELPTEHGDATASVERRVPLSLSMHPAMRTDVVMVRRSVDFRSRRFMSSGEIKRPSPVQAAVLPVERAAPRRAAPISYEEGSGGGSLFERLNTLSRGPGFGFSEDEWDSETDVCTLVYKASLAAQAFGHRIFYFTDGATFSVAFNSFFGSARIVAISPMHTLLPPPSVAPEAHPSFLITILASFFPQFLPNNTLAGLVLNSVDQYGILALPRAPWLDLSSNPPLPQPPQPAPDHGFAAGGASGTAGRSYTTRTLAPQVGDGADGAHADDGADGADAEDGAAGLDGAEGRESERHEIDTMLIPLEFLARDPMYRTSLYWFKKVDYPSDLGSIAAPQPFDIPSLPAPPTIRFGRLIQQRTTSEVWEARLGELRLVVKYVEGRFASAIQRLSNDRDIFAKYKPAIEEVGLGLEGIWQSEIGDVVGVGRLQLFIKLLILHQQIGVIHGSVKPSSSVITLSSKGSDLLRWVDFGAATEHAGKCDGLSCREIRRCLTSMGLSGEKLDELRDKVEAMGLVL